MVPCGGASVLDALVPFEDQAGEAVHHPCATWRASVVGKRMVTAALTHYGGERDIQRISIGDQARIFGIDTMKMTVSQRIY